MNLCQTDRVNLLFWQYLTTFVHLCKFFAQGTAIYIQFSYKIILTYMCRILEENNTNQEQN